MNQTAAGKAVREWDTGYLPVPFFTVNKDGSHGMLSRHCTQNYKIREFERGRQGAPGSRP